MSKTIWMSLVFGLSLYCCLFYVQRGETKVFDLNNKGISPATKRATALSFRSTSCEKEVLKINLTPKCFSQSKTADRNWFSQAVNPILTVEASAPSLNVEKNKRRRAPPFLASMGFSNIFSKPKSHLPLVLHDLNAEPLFSERFPKEITLDYLENNLARVLNEEPGGWSNTSVALFICDDLNQDGQCSDEKQEKVLYRSKDFPICQLPAQLPDCD